MKLPPRCKNKEGLVAKLLRPIYGLKQSGRNWNKELDEFLTKQGFRRLKASGCVYISGYWTIVVIYVDDIFVFSRDLAPSTDLVRCITKAYEAKDLGEISYALGVKVSWNNAGGVCLSQKAYIKSILKQYNMVECRGATTPLEPGVKISKEDSPKTQEEREKMSEVPYRRLIGSLIYLALNTRPDLLYAVTKLSQYNTDPGEAHWHQAKHVLRYLNKTEDHGLTYERNEEPRIKIYCDANWASDVDDRHSLSGMIMKLGRNTVQWYSSKQKSILTSTMEAEYVALARGAKEAIWVRMILKELDLFVYLVSDSIEMYCDNRAAIDYSKNRMENNKTKHIDIAYHIVREMVEENEIKVLYVATNENPADVITKGLKRLAHKRGTESLGLDFAKVGD